MSKPINHVQRIRFVSTWNQSATATDAAESLGITPGYARVRASMLRYYGYDLKRMGKGGRRRNSIVILQPQRGGRDG